MLVPQISAPETSDASTRITGALSEINPGDAELLIVLSPHGARTGVYAQKRGDLGPFGYANIGVDLNHDVEVAAALAQEWGKPLLDEPVDYGVFIPLVLWEPERPPARPVSVVAATFAESSGVEDDALAFADVLTRLGRPKRTFFVASANGSAGLSPRAPLTEIEGAGELEDALLEALRTDVSRVADAAHALSNRGGSCGLGPLLAFARLFAGRSCRVLAHERPVGVGYTVAVTDG